MTQGSLECLGNTIKRELKNEASADKIKEEKFLIIALEPLKLSYSLAFSVIQANQLSFTSVGLTWAFWNFNVNSPN